MLYGHKILERVTDVKDILMSAESFAFDIESNTVPDDRCFRHFPDEITDSFRNYSSKYGVSFLADITHISFYVPGHPLMCLPGPKFEYDTGKCIANPGVAKFIKELFTREKPYTAICHNAVFDLRSIGGHIGFEIPAHQTIWDTYANGIRMMMAEGGSDTSKQLEYAPSLEAMAERVELEHLPDMEPFMSFMKKQRKNLGDMTSSIQKSKDESWEAMKLSRPVTEAQIKSTAKKMVLLYAAYDSRMHYLLYERQQELLEKYVTEEQSFEFYGLTYVRHTAARKLIDYENRITRVAVNQAINGVTIDLAYIKQFAIESQKKFTVVAKQLVDFETNLPISLEDFRMMYWYEMVIKAGQRKGSLNDARKWEGWEYKPFSKEKLAPFITDEKWLETLSQMVPGLSTTAWRKMCESLPEYTFDLTLYIQKMCFDRSLEGQFKAKLVYDWYKNVTIQTDEMTDDDIINSDKWKPFALFILGGQTPPSGKDIDENPFLVTAKARQSSFEGNDLRIYALKNMLFSSGKEALAWYMNKDDRPGSIISLYRKKEHIKADLQSALEFLMHAARDNKVHSNIRRVARTGRFASNTPNLQNLNMTRSRGFMISQFENGILMEFDYSNAENKSGAAISRDNSFAMATETGDFHTSMAKAYWPDKMAEFETKGDRTSIKKWRGKGKAVTFGTAYGMGTGRLAKELQITYEEAKEILEAKDRQFPGVAAAKERSMRKLDELWPKYKVYPAYVTLWSGNRVWVERNKYEPGRVIKSYTGWNYQQQGAVAELIARAQVAMEKWLRENNKRARVLFNVHDSMIVDTPLEEYYEVAQQTCIIMNRVFPESWANRTTPRIHMESSIGPENAIKWGWQNGREYPIPMNVFVNRWGTHNLPPEELEKEPEFREAPTWLGPIHEGWTIETEMLSNPESVNNERTNHWDTFFKTTSRIDTIKDSLVSLSNSFAEFSKDKPICYVDSEGKLIETDPVPAAQRMWALEGLARNGQTQEEITEVQKAINQMELTMKAFEVVKEQLEAWHAQHTNNQQPT